MKARKGAWLRVQATYNEFISAVRAAACTEGCTGLEAEDYFPGLVTISGEIVKLVNE